MTKLFTVSNAEELMGALASVQGGDTIELAAGNYNELSLIAGKMDFDVLFSSEVTLRSADPTKPAVLSGLNIQGVSNLTFDGLMFDYDFNSADPVHIKPFSISGGSDHITIKNSVFDGDLANGISDKADGYGHGTGLNVRDASNISIEGNEFYNWQRGAVFADIETLSVTENNVHSIRSDGFDFIEVRTVLIENNHIHNFSAPVGSKDHRDMIQFWTAGTDSPSADVIIRGNILDIGDGAWAQSIFMRNEEVDSGRAGSEMYYQNITIENNTIYNGHTHGITVGETNGLTIQSNSVLYAQGGVNDLSGGVSVPKINVASTSSSVILKSNIVSAVNGIEGQSDWKYANNIIVDPSEYLEHFVTSSTDSAESLHSFIAIPYGDIEKLSVGSDQLQFPYISEKTSAVFEVHSDKSSENSLIFDASATTGPSGPISEGDAIFYWDFGDGSSAKGRVVKHDFPSAGYYDVKLSVVSQDGVLAVAQYTAGVSGNDVIHFDAQSGQFESLSYGAETSLNSGDIPLLKTAVGYALKLGGEGSKAEVKASAISPFFDADAFEISMSVRANTSASWGEIARVHTSVTTGIDKDGNFVVELFLQDGERVKVVSNGASLNNGNLHDVLFRFDSEAGIAEIIIDDIVMGSENVSGSLAGSPRSLTFGNPWGKQNFDGELSAFKLSADTNIYSTYDGLAEVVPSMPHSKEDAVTPVEDSNTSASEHDTVEPEQEPANEGIPDEETNLLTPLLLDGYELDIANLAGRNTLKLYDDAHFIETLDGKALSLDGNKDYVRIGRLNEFEDSHKLAFSVNFRNSSGGEGQQRLVWNHTKFGLTLEGDGIRVHAKNNDQPIWKGFEIEGLGINDGNLHSAVVMVDAETDRLQVIVDDVLVLDDTETDFDFVGGRESGWTLGTAWNRWFEGEVYDFQVSDDFTFIEPVTESGVLLA